MSIKDLFGKKKTKPVVRKSKVDIASSAESIEAAGAKTKKEQVYIPQLDFSKPANFAFYGSAEKYYSDAFKTIVGTYPYDGSEEEVIEFKNDINYVERYIFDNLYPKANGFARFSADGWGTATTPTGEYGVPTSKEYIYVYGGPLSASSGMTQHKLKYSFSASNLYQEDIYNVIDENPAGRVGTRESNLKYNLDVGSTVEFWLQKDAFDIAKTKKEVVFDLWNQSAYSDAGYGRLLIELSGNNDYTDGSPFFISVNSGSAGFSNTKIGTSITTASLSSWHHYALSFVNDRPNNKIKVKFYIDGALNDEKTLASPLNEITGGMKAFVGSLQAAVIGGTGIEGAGKFSGSLDEFRYWKDRRTSEDVGYNYFRPVRGGTNKKVSNATLGLYYKFNEGIVGTSSTDSVVLDYSGRIGNGQWVGYDSDSRATGSAIVLAGAYGTEEKDPIIRSSHPLVTTLRSNLAVSGSQHDLDNAHRMTEMFPSWMKDRAFETSDPSLDNMTQLMGAQFDKTFLLINRITELKKQNYFADNEKAFPFIKQMVESYGLTVEDLLTAADINEKVLNKNDTQNLENDIQDVKNKLYQNLFNNLFQIYKLKGTEKSFRNIFRCIGLDDELIAIKIYADNTTYTLEDNYKNKLLRAVHVDQNNVDSFGSTMYQWFTASNPNSRSFISGSGDKGLEDWLGFTAECKFMLPAKPVAAEPHYFRTPFVTSSIFGMNSADGSDQTDLSWPGNNYANFNVTVVKDSTAGTNAKFRLSSVSPNPIPELTTSFYNDIFSNTQWAIGVSIKPTSELGNFTSGSDERHASSSGADLNYLLEFYGTNMLGERVLNEFYLTSAIDNTTALNFLRDPKRMFMGAHYTNHTGTLVNRTDLKFDSLRYYNLHNDTASIKQHMIDQESYGRADSLEQINLYATGTLETYIPKFKTLILNWNFNNLSASQTDGTFFIDDYSSGSIDDKGYGRYSGYFNKQHTGIGRYYMTGSTKVFDKVYLNSMQKQTPETTMASNMVNILERDDQKFEKDSKVVRYSVHFEKSPYESINKEILNMFSTVLDFNNVIGPSTERYRQEYKSLENLRRLMFARFENEVSVEKFISYYRWFDHAVGRILEEFIPGSVKYEASLATLIQSHILERNKYWTKFPTMEFKGTDPEAGLAGYEEMNYNWRVGHAPVSNKQAYNSRWWNERASRERGILSSSDGQTTHVNYDREKIRMEIESFQSSSGINLAQSSSLPAGYIPTYRGKEAALRRFTKPYKFSMDIQKVIHGGTNFNKNKSYEFTFNALHPAGPVYTPGGALIPQNTLLAFENEAYDKRDIKDIFDPNKKEKVFGKVIHGRNHGDGTGYSNTDMNYAFPFNVYRSTVSGGYGNLVNDGYATGTIITNLHSDTYGPDLEVPMQGPFTEKWVGGLQARHADINRSSSFGNFKRLDDHSTRPEAWRLLVGKCSAPKGAIGMVGADYPWPTSIAEIEAKKFGSDAVYPMTSSGKAHFYRDEHAKRPVNIRNIRTITGAISHGNYRHNYEVVHSVGSNQNPRAFLRDTPVLPFQISPGRNAAAMLSLDTGGSTNASDGNSITLSDGVITKTLTFKTTPTSPDHILIGTSVSSTFINIASNINLSHSWGLRTDCGPNKITGAPLWLINVDYQGAFTNTPVTTTWGSLKVSSMSGSAAIAKTADITNVLTIRNIFRNQYGHVYTAGPTRYEKPMRSPTDVTPLNRFSTPRYDYDYSVGYLTGSGDYANKTIIKSRFAAPGGIETDTAGYRDFRGDEYSAYSPVPYRNLRVRRPGQQTHNFVPDISGAIAAESGGPGIRVFDQNGFDIGLNSNLARHTARFGRDSLIYPPTEYRPTADEYSLTRSFIGYGTNAAYRADINLQGWWRLDNYLMQGALTGNIDSSGKGHSVAFASASEAPATTNSGRYVDYNKPSISRWSNPDTGPSPYVQTASFTNFPASYAADVLRKFPIGTAATWNGIIGSTGGQGFTLAAWVRINENEHTNYPNIFNFGHWDVAFYVDNDSSAALTLRYYSKYGSHGAEAINAATATGSLFDGYTTTQERWMHVAVTAHLGGTDIGPTASFASQNPNFEGQRVKFYINGRRSPTFDASTGSVDTRGSFYGISTQDCYIGNDAGCDYPFNGNIADAAVWNIPLTEEDIVAIYSAAKVPIAAHGEMRNSASLDSAEYGIPPFLYGQGPGSSYDEYPSLHKIHRNNVKRVKTTEKHIFRQHKNSMWIASSACPEGDCTSHKTNTSSFSMDQWEVNKTSKRKMIYSFWLKDRATSAQGNNVRNIFSLNAPMTGAYTDGFSQKQIFSVQFEEQGGSDPRKMAFRFGSGENSNAASEMRTWYTTNEVIPGKGQGSPWTHFVVATDGWAGPGPRIWVNGVSQSILLTNAGSSVGSYDGLMTTAGGGKFLLGGGAYTHKNTNAYGDDNDNFYIDDFAMWQGTSTASLTTAMIDELYHSGQYVNLNKTSGGLGTPFLYYTFDDLADPQSGSMALQPTALIKDQSGNGRDLKYNSGEHVGSVIMITASTYGTPFTISKYDEVHSVGNEYDNYYIQHPIPRSDVQYAWITAAFGGSPTASIRVGYAPFDTWDDGLDNQGNNPYDALLTASLVGEYYASNNRIAGHNTNRYTLERAPAQGISPFGFCGYDTYHKYAPNRTLALGLGGTYGVENTFTKKINWSDALLHKGTHILPNLFAPARQVQAYSYTNNAAPEPLTPGEFFHALKGRPWAHSSTVNNGTGIVGPGGTNGSSFSFLNGSASATTGSHQYFDTEGGAVNGEEYQFRTGPNSAVLLNPVEDRLNLYLTKLNGPYGAANFTFIRNQDNPILKTNRNNNIYTVIKAPSNSLEDSGSIFSRRSDLVRWYSRVTPVTSKYGTLTYGFGVTRTFKNKFNQDIEVEGTTYFKSSFANQKAYFNNSKLNEFLSLDDKDNKTFYDKFKNLYLEGGLESALSPIESIQFVKYNETVYPSSRNMYSDVVRKRPNFTFENWRNSYEDRIYWDLSPGLFGGALGPWSFYMFLQRYRGAKVVRDVRYTVDLTIPKNPLPQSQEPLKDFVSFTTAFYSKWPLDVARTYYSSSQNALAFIDNRQKGGEENTAGAAVPIARPAGRLLNNHTHWHGATITDQDERDAGGSWAASNRLTSIRRYAKRFITSSCLYSLKAASWHSHSFYAWNRPKVCTYNTASSTHEAGDDASELPASKFPNKKGDLQQMAYNTTTAYSYQGYGDAPWVVAETAGKFVFNTSSLQRGWVSGAINPAYDSYAHFSQDLRAKNKDMSVIPEFRVSSHIQSFSDQSFALDTTIYDLLEIPGGHMVEPFPDSADLDSRSVSSSFYRTYCTSDFLEHFEILKDDHKDVMSPTTLTLRCTALKKFIPYKGFYPAERTVQMYDQFMKSYGSTITSSGGDYWLRKQSISQNWSDPTPGEIPRMNLARPIITPLFAPGILFNSIKSGLGVDFPILTTEGIPQMFGLKGTNPDGFNSLNRDGLFAMQKPGLNGQRITASVAVGPRYKDFSGSTDGAGKYTIRDRYLQIVGANRPGTLDWSRRIPFEGIIQPERYMADIPVHDMFVNDTTAILPTDGDPNGARTSTISMTASTANAKMSDPTDTVYSLMADNFIGAVPDFFLDSGELGTLTSKPQSELNLYLVSGSCYAMRLRMRRSMNKTRDWGYDLQEIFHKTASVDYNQPANPEDNVGTFVEIEAGDATRNYYREIGQARQIADYEIFQDPIRQRGLYETLTMYNRPSAFGPPVTGRELNHGTKHAVTTGSARYGNTIGFSSWTSSYGTNAVLDSSNGFNPAFTPPYYDGHAVMDFVFKVKETKEYTVAEIMGKTETQDWRFDPGWLVRQGNDNLLNNKGMLLNSASFTLIPGEVYYDQSDGGLGAAGFKAGSGITGTLGPQHGGVRAASSANMRAGPLRDSNRTFFTSSGVYGGAPYAGNHINQTSMQLKNVVNAKLLGTIPSTTTDNEGNLIIRKIAKDEDKVWIIQPKWETPILNFKDCTPYPQGSISGSTHGIGPTLTVGNKSSLVAPTGMWHQFGRLPKGNEGVFLEIIDIPKNWLNGHWSIKKNLNPGWGLGGEPVKAWSPVKAWGGYNSAYTASAYDGIFDETKVQSLSKLLGFRNSEQTSFLTKPSSGISRAASVRLGEIADKKIVSEAIVAIPFVEKGRQKYFFEIDKYFIDIAKADRSPPGGVPDAGDSIKDMVEKMERYVLPPSMDFTTYPEIVPFSMYIFEFTHEFDKQDLANMWQNVAPKLGRSYEIAEAKISHDLNQDELMGFALAKAEESFMEDVRWMVFKVKQKSMATYEDRVAGTKLPKLSFKLKSPLSIMPRFSKFKIRRARLQNSTLKLSTAQITPTFKFGRGLSQASTDLDLTFNWPYDYFSIVEFAKIDASLSLEKPDDIEVVDPQGPQISGLSALGPIVSQTQASKVKASVNTRVAKRRKSVVGKSQKKVSVTKKSNVAGKTVKGMKFSKVIKF